jgi:hypothetical protein
MSTQYGSTSSGSGKTGNTTPKGTATAPAAAPTTGNFLKWGGAFAVYALVMFALDENDSYSTVVTAFAWLVAGTAVVHWYAEMGQNLSALTGVKL